MADNFIQSVKDLNKEYNNSELETISTEEIITNFNLKNIKGQDKVINGFTEYNSEDLIGNNIFPGNVYTFVYNTDSPTVYSFNGKNFEFIDKLPLLLVLSINNDLISGINLNLCTKDLRIIILNLIQNIDPEFFEIEAYNMATTGKAPISTKIMSFFGKQTLQTDILKYLQKVAKIDYSLIFRTYKKSKIRDLHFIEPWQWQYIPFISYNSSIKGNILNAIHKITGMSNITLSI